ncbi:hypothetical protein LPBF_05805 [Flavobacterium crassostreae]|uniref:Uncharacterized protein n=1 Tax=Flavobacterium crassostreae TaxID=1763534 RepID=A0A1B9E3C7_9FLAO|nr:hypothetical protein LPBF_05805 [Flavobacterium crassostreae]
MDVTFQKSRLLFTYINKERNNTHFIFYKPSKYIIKVKIKQFIYRLISKKRLQKCSLLCFVAFMLLQNCF